MAAYLSLDGLRHLWDGIKELLGQYMNTKLLWENASPTSSFDGQTLPAQYTWTGYDQLVIETILDTSSTPRAQYRAEHIIDCYGGSKAYLSMHSLSGGMMFARGVTLNEDGTILFSDASKRTFANIGTLVSQTNSGCVPLRIYGIKGVNTQ